MLKGLKRQKTFHYYTMEELIGRTLVVQYPNYTHKVEIKHIEVYNNGDVVYTDGVHYYWNNYYTDRIVIQ